MNNQSQDLLHDVHKLQKIMDNGRGDKKVMGHLSSPLKNQTDILQTLSLLSDVDIHPWRSES